MSLAYICKAFLDYFMKMASNASRKTLFLLNCDHGRLQKSTRGHREKGRETDNTESIQGCMIYEIYAPAWAGVFLLCKINPIDIMLVADRKRRNAMKYTEEERLHLVEELKKLSGSKPMFYLKFCGEESFAQDVCKGRLYANTPKHFRDKEIKSGERGQGDRYELLSIIEAQKVVMTDSETGEVVLVAPKGSLRVQFKDDDIVPIISFVGIPLEDMILVDADEDHADFAFPFTDEEYETMEKKFGKYVVVLNSKELENHVISYCNKIGCDYLLDKIEYCDQNRLDRMQAFNKSGKERFLYKDSDLAYQREYRLAFAHEIPTDHFIEIGELTNTTIMKSEQLKGLIFSIGYVSHSINEE